MRLVFRVNQITVKLKHFIEKSYTKSQAWTTRTISSYSFYANGCCCPRYNCTQWLQYIIWTTIINCLFRRKKEKTHLVIKCRKISGTDDCRLIRQLAV